ncbi:MAG: A24 family peptidase [Candidatus Nanoarchaeia archaeon]
MMDLLLITVGIICLAIATAVDIKKREVPDWISYSMIASGFGLRLINSITTNDWSYLLYGLLGFGAMTCVGMLMYYAKQWGGGDTKLIMGLGVTFATFGAEKLFLVDLFINVLVIGAAYGILFGVILAIKNWGSFTKELKKVMAKGRMTRLTTLIIGFLVLVTMLLIQDKIVKLILGITAAFLIIYVYLITMMKAVEKACMYKYTEVEKLTEGDWVAEEVKANNKVICGPKDLGLEKEQIEMLKKAKIKKVLVKEGIPFVPPFFIGTLLTFAFGNVITSLL